MSSSNAEAPDDSSNSDTPPPPPPSDSASSTTPPPQKSSPPPPKSPPPPDVEDDSPPPPSPHKSPPPPPPPEALSPPPSPPPAKSPPPPKHSPPPEKASPPPASPPPVKFSPPPSLAPPPNPTEQSPDVVPSTPDTPPSPDSPAKDKKKSPPMPVEDPTPSPPKPPRDLVNSPPVLPFKPPPPAILPKPTTSSPSRSGGGSSGATKSSSGYSSGSTGAIVGGVVGGMLFMILLACIWMFCRKKKQKQYNQVWNNLFPSASPSPDYKQHTINIPPGMPSPAPQRSSWSAVHLPPRPMGVSEGTYTSYNYPNRTPPYSPDMGGFPNQNHLPYEELVVATDGFSNANMLGQGGFGYVHRGILPNGKEVAVKSLKSGSGQGEREFQAEVDIISRVHHRHLVSLVGYTIAAEKRLLVYEFVPNNTLEYHLHKSNNPPLDFPTRIRIALGSAKGLAYLHEDCHPRIIHRDIKAANILLDYNFEAQVADFGLARLYSDTNTHVSTRVMGTFGYLAPEYALSGKLTDKSDVFSFGVVLLELITGRRAVGPTDQSMEESSLVDWARPLLTKALAEENYDELVDRRLNKNYNRQDMTHMVACAAASTRHSAKRRPTMSKVVRTLEGDMSLDALDPPRTWDTSPTSIEYDTTTYNADMKKFRQIALGTQTFGTTSEYGLNPSSSSDSSSSSNGNSPRNSSN